MSGDVQAAQRYLEPIQDHLLDAGLGTVSEIFDGAPPHHPRGAPAQAWSVACILEAWWRLERERRGQRGAKEPVTKMENAEATAKLKTHAQAQTATIEGIAA